MEEERNYCVLDLTAISKAPEEPEGSPAFSGGLD